MIDSPSRLLAARGYGKFVPVRGIEFAAFAAGFDDSKGRRKIMISLLFLSKRPRRVRAAQREPDFSSAAPGTPVFSRISETMR
jgi:hypothetical protein